MSESDTSELQIKLSFLERHVEEQDRVILQIRRETDLIKSELMKLKDRLQSGDNASDQVDPLTERPPHY